MYHEERSVEAGHGIVPGVSLPKHGPELVGQRLPGIQFRNEPADPPVTALAIPQDLLYGTQGHPREAARIRVCTPWGTGWTS